MDIDALLNPMRPTRTVYSVRQFVSWYKQKQLTLRPPFQRRILWKSTAKSYLVDSLLRGMPLPIVILREKPGISLDPQSEVVDGQQRLTTLISFIEPELFSSQYRFTLSKSLAKEVGGETFAQLSDQLKLRILDYEISTHILSPSVGDIDVLRIFQRLNSTGNKLNAQELRNAQFQGAFKQFVSETSLSHLSFWLTSGLFSADKLARMDEVEFTAELTIQLMKGTTGSSASQITKYYEDFEDDFPDETNCGLRFQNIMELVQEHQALFEPASPFRRTSWFYALFGLIHDGLYGATRNEKEPFLESCPPRAINNRLWDRLEQFGDVLSHDENRTEALNKALFGRTTHPGTRRVRADFLRETVVDVL